METDLLRRVFPGDSEVAARLRQVDWMSNELGMPDTWPPSLQSAVATCLTSRVPMQVWWKRVVLYNDASIQLVGHRHPSALARSGLDVLGEHAWQALEPVMQRAMETAATTWCENVRLVLPRRLPAEEVFATFSF